MENNVEVYKVASNIIATGFKEAGIEDGEEFKALKKLLTSKKLTVDKFGEEHWEDDNTSIARGVELVLRLRNLLNNKVEEVKSASVEIKMKAEDIDRLENISRELLGLEKRLRDDKMQQGEVIDINV